MLDKMKDIQYYSSINLASVLVVKIAKINKEKLPLFTMKLL
jgi:hypothetical protein